MINQPLRAFQIFLKLMRSLIAGKNRGDAAEVVAAIQKDPYAIGFCKLINVLDFKNQGMVENIRLAAD